MRIFREMELLGTENMTLEQIYLLRQLRTCHEAASTAAAASINKSVISQVYYAGVAAHRVRQVAMNRPSQKFGLFQG